MADRKQKKYIQQFIDGELPPDKRSYIEELIGRDADAKSYYEGLLKVDEILREDASTSESVDMEQAILRQIQQSQPTGTPNPVKQHWTEFIWPSAHWGIGYALVIGVLLGVFILSPVLKNRNLKISDNEMAGSMTNMTTAFTLPINVEGVNATINASYASQDFLRIEIDVESDDIAQVRLSFNKDQFSLWTLKAIDQNPESRIMAGYGSVEIINRGDNTYLILLKKLSSLEETIRIEVFSNDMRQYENIVTVK